MTIAKLIKTLVAIHAKHGPRVNVAVYPETFSDGNGCWQVCNVHEVLCQSITQSDGDGFVKTTTSGQEIEKVCVVFYGDGYDPKQHGQLTIK